MRKIATSSADNAKAQENEEDLKAFPSSFEAKDCFSDSTNPHRAIDPASTQRPTIVRRAFRNGIASIDRLPNTLSPLPKVICGVL